MMRHRFLIVVAAMVLAAAVVSAGEEVRIQPIVSEGRVLVSIAVADAWSLGTREVLQSGLTLMFEYQVELRRPAPFWFFDPTLARVGVNSSAKFDTLAGGYKVTRYRNGRIVRSERVTQEADVRDWLTRVDQVSLDPVSPLEPNAEYYVHVRLTTSPKRSVSLWSILPFSRDGVTARQSFTYIK
jgi:hypothetical protein